MSNARTFTSAFDGLDLKTLRWEQTRRQCVNEFFGYKPGDALPEEHFKDRIPADIGDAFGYQIKTLVMATNFSRQFYNTQPLSVEHCLGFYFGQISNPEHPLGTAQGFEYLSKQKLVFWSGRFGAPNQQIDMESQNLKMHHQPESFGGRNTFTEVGRQVMEDLLANAPRILSVEGLRDAEKSSLAFLLGRVEQEYRAGTLEPKDFFYT